MKRRIDIPLKAGYCLVELLLVLALLGVGMACAGAFVATGVQRQEARGAAQTGQAGAGWAQLGVLWQSGASDLDISAGGLSVSHDLGLCGGVLGALAPTVDVRANVARWKADDGVKVGFGGCLASPDSGGSLYFSSGVGAYRVVVRPESGLTARSWIEP